MAEINRPYINLTEQELKTKLKEWEKADNKAYDAPDVWAFMAQLNRNKEKYNGYRQELILRATPKYSKYSKLDKSCKMPIEEFIRDCESGGFIDNDGSGVYADDNGVTNIGVLPSDIMSGQYRTDFPYVCWYNK
jgi:hypothetical protein